jgi:alkylhydroperoxidase family enzyme
MQHHLASSKRAGVTPEDWKALRNPSAGRFSPAEQAALAFAEKLTRASSTINDDDIARLKSHFSDAQVLDLHVLVGLVNLTNRLTDPLGLEIEFAPEKV